jgi:aminopeptidase N
MRISILLLVAMMAWAAAPAAAHEHASPGAPGIGDRLFPTLGNGGYDVRHYDLDLRYATSAPDQPLDGTVTILALATQSLSRFDLDFGGESVGSVSVNARPAAWTRDGDELVITPRHRLRRGRLFVVKVEHFVAVPVPAAPGIGSTAFFSTPDGSGTAGQPDGAHDVFPCNDHPRDKASYSFRFDVPAGTLAVANGVQTGRRTRGDRTTFWYRQRQPMASELIQLAVGRYDVTDRGLHRGTIIRDVTSPRLTEAVEPDLALELGHLDYMENRVGRYPFDSFGTFVVDAELGFALETQTLSLFDRPWFDFPQGLWDPVMVHELAHMWFGDSVSPATWSDIWLNEGHASWYEFTYAEEHGFLAVDTQGYPDEQGYATLEELMRAVYRHGDQWRAESGPVARPLSAEHLFDLQVYHGGALVLYALRQEIGARAFERLERAWVSGERGGSATSGDFIALASRVAHRDLRGFLGAWLYGTTTPPMPGHADWTTDPVVEGLAPLSAEVRRRR